MLILSFIPLLYIYFIFRVPGLFYIFIWFLGAIYTAWIHHNKRTKTLLLIAAIPVVMVLLIAKGIIIFNPDLSPAVCFGMVQILFAALYLNYYEKLTFLRYFKVLAPFSYTLYLIHFPIILFIYSLLKKHVAYNLWYLVIESICDLFLVVMISYLLAKVTEDKYFFRKLFTSFTLVKSRGSK